MNTTKKGRLVRRIRESAGGWLLLLPIVLMLILVKWSPIVSGIVKSFYATRGYETTEFVGLLNYKNVLTDTLFFKTLGNTIMYVVWSLLIGFAPPILLAVLLNEVRVFRRGFRVITYLPYVAPTIVTSLIWMNMYYPGEAGVLNTMFNALGIPPQTWLQNSAIAIPLIIISMTWASTPGSAVIYLSALQGVSNELYEAAIIDGAGILKRFRYVTLPSISGTMLLLFVRQIIGIFQIMEQPLVMTGGGPDNATMSINLTAYNYAFTYMKVSRSLALSTCAFLFLALITIVYFRVEKKIGE